MNENFEVRPSVVRAIIQSALKFGIAVSLFVLAAYVFQRFSGTDISFIYDYVAKDLLIETIAYSAAAAFILLMLLTTFGLSNIKLRFMREGFEYNHGFLIKEKKDFFYSNIIRVNYENGILDGNIDIELTATDILKITIPHVAYPGATTSRIKRMIDDSLSQKLYERLHEADRSIEQETADRIVDVVRSRAVTKENLADEIARAADGEKLSKNIFEAILSHLLATGRLSKSDLSNIMFSMYEKGLISKKDIADVLFHLNNA